jgi:regulator of CtrA degradation
LERLIAEAGLAPRQPALNPIAAQLGMLEKAFGPTE